ncbi:LOW QUALITY PROTEIN: RNA polymerase II subunit A C-terminal domain phosphatase [Gouania willdenowi]|uniref:LOW QUALITY PROTEIN: RNA polymerase II subunit A C-terminal domain phosphatase n=1 Tax=Gouania willdenowi TaxID=441366 RepID=UPI0010544786|nr:LOW QUALITY PROTEIN: RNA polymerase II subunit A C-terminal domain phosphatase [Gouania willdenowi]
MEDPAGGSGGAAAEGPAVQVADVRWPLGGLPLRLLEWKVKPGTLVNVDSVLALCVPVPPDTEPEAGRLPERRVKADRAGLVKELCCQPGQVIPPGGVIVRIAECSHPIVMKGLCAECGQDLTQLQSSNGKQQSAISTATVSMVHSVPELMVSSEQAEQLGREDQQRLHRNKKLVLMVDLDQTLIHTTEQHCQRMSNKGIFHFQLGRGEPMLHTRLRPHCKEFLEKIAKLYELHVFTFGSRLYAHTIAGFLDPEKKLFSHRILSRDECIDPYSKTGNLRNLFPCGDSMVCIIDDREDVWKFAPNLITVKKYIYFQGTGDINAPPGSREAQVLKKGGPSSRLTDGAEQAESHGSEEQNNGLRRKSKESSASSSSSSQGASTNNRTDNSGPVNDQSGLSKASETHVETQELDRTQEVGSSALSQEPNNLDFDLSSDSDNESVTEKPSQTKESQQHAVTQEVATAVTQEVATPVTQEVATAVTQEVATAVTQEVATAVTQEVATAVTQEVATVVTQEVATAVTQEAANTITQEVANAVTQEAANTITQEAANDDGANTEPAGVLPLDSDLGNGCTEKREPETESQNSEQSGVTLGEELLGMEDEEEEEEEEEPDIDQDDHLIYLEEVLERIHTEYYSRYEVFLRNQASEMPDIRRIVPELKSKTLEKTMIVFSGLFPTNCPVERTREFYHAKALGAHIGRNLVLSSKDSDRTTHLIAARAGTEKVRQAQSCKHLHVVNPDWLWGCLERWERVEEQLYPLKEDHCKTPRSSSPAGFPDTLSSQHKALFQPTPVQPRPVSPPAPEIRTYDPVTGKLIRRGPQVPRPPPYLHNPGSLSLPDTEQMDYREGPQDDPTGSCPHSDQPGPSRRKRQPSMSESMPLYTLCKEDLDSMDKEVDDILGEESDNESEDRGKEKPCNEEEEEEEEHTVVGGLRPQVLIVEERLHTASEGGAPHAILRGHKRKHDNVKDDDEEKDQREEDEESSKDSNEDEEGSSSEADEMAAALEAELNDFM